MYREIYVLFKYYCFEHIKAHYYLSYENDILQSLENKKKMKFLFYLTEVKSSLLYKYEYQLR